MKSNRVGSSSEPVEKPSPQITSSPPPPYDEKPLTNDNNVDKAGVTEDNKGGKVQTVVKINEK
jgi:hypothetical protein